MMKSKVLLIYTGGTIGMNRNAATGALEPFDFEQLLCHVPELSELPTEITTYQFSPPIDSSDMSPRLWTDMVHIIADNYDRFDGFVVLHGTDTMAYTASALSFMLEDLSKPVVLTGSQLPIGQLRTDGKENVITAIEIASALLPDGTARVPEVCIYFNGHLMRGNRTTKQSADEFNAFESFNYPHLADAGVHINYHDEFILHPPSPTHPPRSGAPTATLNPQFRMDDNVIIFSLFPGVREDLIRHIIATPNLRSIVMRTFGSGNAPHSPWLLNALRDGTRNGKVIVNVSQCLQGCVEMGRYGTGQQLAEAGVISACDATVEATLTKLMYLQGKYESQDDVRRLMEQNLRGEITK
jgi:L-asparaginase